MVKNKSNLKLKMSIFAIILVFALAIVAGVLFAPQNKNVVYADGIKDTNVRYDSVKNVINVQDKKVIEITEFITVTYKNAGINLGLSRNVSKINKITRIVDGKKYVNTTRNEYKVNYVKMDDLPEYYFVEESGDYFYINTGADGDYKVGQHTYEINYTLDMGHDFINAFDDFTFDIMSYAFRGAVGKFSAEITFPKDILNGKTLEEVVSVRTNHQEALGLEALNLKLEENTITCDYTNLPKGTGFTLQVILEEGYFNTSYTPSGFYIALIPIFIVCILGVAVCVLINRMGRRCVKTPEFYAPEGYSPLDVARVYRGKILPKDFASLVISWASIGLVKIEFVTKRHIILHKLKNYPDLKSDEPLYKYKKLEKKYFEAIFEDGNTFDTKEHKGLKGALCTIKIRKAVGKIYEASAENRTAMALKYKFPMQILALLPLILFVAWQISSGVGSAILFMLLFPIIGILVFVHAPIPLWFKIIWCGGFGGVPLYFMATNFLLLVYDVYYLFYIALAIAILGSYSLRLIVINTPQEKKALGKVLGFKNFLVTAELEKLEMLIHDDPEYFYNILPYCYVFGITHKMEKKFKELHAPMPEYISEYGYAGFAVAVGHSMGSSMCGSSSGGGSSGGGGGSGGSSGGGGGGGGCGGR